MLRLEIEERLGNIARFSRGSDALNACEHSDRSGPSAAYSAGGTWIVTCSSQISQSQ